KGAGSAGPADTEAASVGLDKGAEASQLRQLRRRQFSVRERRLGFLIYTGRWRCCRGQMQRRGPSPKSSHQVKGIRRGRITNASYRQAGKQLDGNRRGHSRSERIADQVV